MHQTITPSALSAASPGILSPKSSLRFWKNFLVSSMLLFAALLPTMSKAQTALTIGSGTTSSSFFPIYTCYGYNYSQQTFLASEIVAAGATAGTPAYISSISFNPNSIIASSFSSLCKDWVIYLGNTSKTTFSSTSDWVPFGSLTKVFDGVVTVSGTGWFKITFGTPFYWDGTSNIVVGIDENTPSWYCTASWVATSRSGTRGLLYYSDGTNPDPASPPTANYSSGITSDIRFDYTPATPCSGTTVGGSTVASATTLCPGGSVTLSVTGATVGTGMSWQWQSSTTATGPWVNIVGATSTNLTIAPPSGTTTYYRRQTTCTSTTSSAFSTGVAVAVSSSGGIPYSENFEAGPVGVNVPCATASPSFSTGATFYYGS
jgi:large repetitive protein